MTVSSVSLLPFVIAAVVAALWRPGTALLFPLVFHGGYLLRSRIPLAGWELPTTLLELLVWIAVLTAGVEVWKRASAREAYHAAFRTLPRSVVLCAVIFLVAATVSAVIAPHPRTAWGQWKAFVVEPIAYAGVLLPLLRAARGRRAVASALLLGGLVSAGASLVTVAYCLLPTAYCSVTADFGRLRGIYDVPNSLALVLAPLTVFAASLAASREVLPLRRLARWSLVLLVPTLLLTQSLAGILAAAVGFGVALLAQGNLLSLREAEARGAAGRLRAGAVGSSRLFLGVGVLLAAGLVLQGASGKLSHALAADSPRAARLQIWAVSLTLVRDHPFQGTGLGTFEPAYQEKLHALLKAGSRERRLLPTPSALHPPLEWVVRDPHNIVLSLWLNTGVLGLLSMGGLAVLAVRTSMRARNLPTPYSLLPTASVGALVALLLFGLVDVPYFKNDLSLLWWVFLSSAVVAVPPARKNHRG